MRRDQATPSQAYLTGSVYFRVLKRFGIKPSGSPTGNRATRARCPRRKSRPVRHAPGTSGVLWGPEGTGVDLTHG